LAVLHLASAPRALASLRFASPACVGEGIAALSGDAAIENVDPQYSNPPDPEPNAAGVGIFLENFASG
jgi:hypothetical protein